MPAIGNVVINDGQSTPVAHTFNPVDATTGYAKWADKSGGVGAGFITLTHTFRDPTSSSRQSRISFNFAKPTLVTNPTTGMDSVARTTRVNVEFILPEDATLQERKDVLAYAKNFLATATATSVVQDLEHVY